MRTTLSRTPEEMSRPVIGYAVYLVDGRPVGTVSAVNRSSFRLSNPTGSTWLNRSSIFTVDNNKITLICGEERLGAYVVQPYRRRELREAL